MLKEFETKYIPTNLGSLFNLTALSMENKKLVGMGFDLGK